MNDKMRKIVLIVLLIALLAGLAAPVFMYANAEETAQTGEAEAVPAKEDEGLRVGSEEEFLEIVRGFIEDIGIGSSKISVALCYTATGECYYYNPDDWFATGSIYKLPLCMMISKRQHEGEDFSNLLGGKVETAMHDALAFSSNGYAMTLYKVFFNGLQDFRKKEAVLAGISLDELPAFYLNVQQYNAPFVLEVLKELYYNSENYPNIIEYMTGAQPGEYLDNIHHDEYPYAVAQKYGSVDYNHHIAGIVFCDTPVLIVVETLAAGYPRANSFMGMLSEAFADYSRLLDGRLAEIEK